MGRATRNRYGVTVRFDRTEQKHLEDVCNYYKAEPRHVMKLAFKLLYESTNQLKRQHDEETNDTTESNSTGMSAEEITAAQSGDAGDTTETDTVQPDTPVHVSDSEQDTQQA